MRAAKAPKSRLPQGNSRRTSNGCCTPSRSCGGCSGPCNVGSDTAAGKHQLEVAVKQLREVRRRRLLERLGARRGMVSLVSTTLSRRAQLMSYDRTAASTYATAAYLAGEIQRTIRAEDLYAIDQDSQSLALIRKGHERVVKALADIVSPLAGNGHRLLQEAAAVAVGRETVVEGQEGF